MPTAQKEKVVQSFEKDAKDCQALVVTCYQGLKTEELNEFRAQLRPLQSEYRVVKNSLTRIALKNAGMADLAAQLQGPTALVLERGDVFAPLKAVFDFAKKHENLKVAAGFLDGRLVSAKDLKTLSELPSKEVLLSMLLGALQAPMRNLVSVLQAPIRDLVGVLDQVAKKAPEAKP